MNRQGVLLAGGTGSRLYPITKSINKQLLPIYNKPMVFYSLSLFMLAEIRSVTLVCNPKDLEHYFYLLGDGSQLGMTITYKTQSAPNGIPSALFLAEDDIKERDILLILGDNILVGNNLSQILSVNSSSEAKIFGYTVKNAGQFGVILFDHTGTPIEIREKPKNITKGHAIPGIYFLPNSSVSMSKKLEPSERGETEIADLLSHYLSENKLSVELLGRGVAWMDTGTPDGLAAASNLVQTLESRHNYQIANIHELAYRNGWISVSELHSFALECSKSDYGRYLLELIDEIKPTC